MSSGDGAALGRRAARGCPLAAGGARRPPAGPPTLPGPSRARGPELQLLAASRFQVFLVAGGQPQAMEEWTGAPGPP